jgi:two-component system response regulator HydG
MRGHVLVIDDEPSMCELLEAGLEQRGFQVAARTSAAEGVLALGGEEFDAVVTDLNMPGMNGAELCERIAANRPDVPVIVITAFGSLETAIAAIRAGAYDFITKPLDVEALALALDRAVRLRSLKEEVKRLHQAVAKSRQFQDLLGDSAPMRDLFELIARVAASEASVLLSGETGTGKELVARAIHRESRRGAGPFIAINCAAMPEALLESELFGHARGAFTGAVKEKHGLFLQATGGTLFLDEVGELSPNLQPKLLRALEQRSVRPVGGDAEVSFDARIVAATNRDLEAAVADGSFRNDLFFRLDVIHLEIPPLRARGNDVLLLAQRFTEQCAARAGKKVTGISGAAGAKLLAYPWPGNVRELENAIERAVALTSYECLAVEDFPERIQSYRRSEFLAVSDDPAAMAPLAEIERRYVLRVHGAVGGNKALAARILGLDRKTLYRKLEQWAGARGTGPEEPRGPSRS